MQISNKKTISIITLILLMTTSFQLALIPSTNAHTPPWSVPTYMYVNVSPNPTGVGQEVNINFWLNTPPPTAIAPPYPDFWQNLTVVVKTPDGKTQTLGPFTSDTTGGSYTTYTPNVVGNYTFQSFFSGQTLNPNPPPGTRPSAAAGDYYQPSESKIVTLLVQEEPILEPPVNPYPTEYWTRPIYGNNNNWYTIGGNWLHHDTRGTYNATGSYAPYTLAPKTAHILWTKVEAFGGIMGGEFGGDLDANYYSTRQYETMFQPIVINGILYYTEFPGSVTYPSGNVALDLRTGETVWTSSYPQMLPSTPITPTDTVPTAGASTTLTYGQILDYYSINQYGGLAYLWSTGTPAIVASATKIQTGTTTYNMFDAKSGNYLLSIANCTAFNAVTQDDKGNLIGYYVNNSIPTAPTLNQWNSTKAILKYNNLGLFQILGLEMWSPPKGAIIPFSAGIEWTIPLANNISGNPITLSYSGLSNNVILMSQYSSTGGGLAFQSGWIIEAAYDAVKGQLLWGPINRTENVGTRVSYGTTGNGNQGYAIGDGAWVETDLNAETVTGYNLLTGEKIWGPEKLPNAHPFTSFGVQQIVANGTIYIWTFGGDVYAINIKTGDIKWEYHSPSTGSENPYGTRAFWSSGGRGVLADGLLFLAEGHEFNPPLYHGTHLQAFDINTGQIVWNVTGMFVNGGKAIADGILVGVNAYDNQIYAFGKGPSKTTVTAPSVGVTTSSPITITGSVIDISAGSKQQVVAANFPNGLPCVSDASMSKFMEAVYMQQPMPIDVSGVKIDISVVDSNGNWREIGSTTSNAMGTYGFTWTPDIPGDYTIIATFEGTGSYYGSSAQTYFHASEQTSSTPTATTQADLATIGDIVTYLAIGVIAIIISIAIVGFLLLRKRP